MADRPPSDLTDKMLLRVPDGLRARVAALAKANGRSANAEAVKALESWLDLAEHGQKVAEEMQNDGPAPERGLGTWYLHSEDGRITKRTLISEWEAIEAERGIHAGDVRIINVSKHDEANDPVKARMAGDVRRSREIAEARAAEKGKPE